jgi:three-Cys-motif partner protein
MSEHFFEQPTEQSLVKAAIVKKYFWAWAKVVISQVKRYSLDDQRIAYVDLFAGPGQYKDGTPSTPLLILKRAIEEPDMRKMLVTVFNDVKFTNTQSLRKAVQELPGIERLKHKPIIWNQEVGPELVRVFKKTSLIPTLSFLDPWGYQGLSLDLVNVLLKDWGCDCIFFFNYNRINMGLNNESVKEHMNALFGKQRADNLRARLDQLTPQKRELTIVEELSQALKEVGCEYVLPFCFKKNQVNRTSHHLIFVSKHPRGYSIMKDIMAKESSSATQGVASFVYNLADRQQPLLFELARPLDDLADMLLKEYAGRRMSMKEIYEQHHIGLPYIKRNYKDVLRELEAQGKIITEPPAHKRRKRHGKVTFADKTKVSFPAKSK